MQEFFARLERHPPCASFDEAYKGLVSTLEAVEDELTGVANNPANWREDGRLYPPQHDHWSPEGGYPRVTRMRTKGHYIFIATNGAIEVWDRRNNVLEFSKAGLDGGKVWDP